MYSKRELKSPFSLISFGLFSGLVGVILFFVIPVHGGELDSLNQEIAVQQEQLGIDSIKSDLLPVYLNTLLKSGMDTVQVYNIASHIQKLAAMKRRAAHLKSVEWRATHKQDPLADIPDWNTNEEIQAQSHTVLVIEQWLERPTVPAVKPIRHELIVDEPDMLKDILN